MNGYTLLEMLVELIAHWKQRALAAEEALRKAQEGTESAQEGK